MEKEETPSGILVGGTDNGSVVMWNPARIVDGGTGDAVVFQSDKHTGMVFFEETGSAIHHGISRVLKSQHFVGASTLC